MPSAGARFGAQLAEHNVADPAQLRRSVRDRVQDQGHEQGAGREGVGASSRAFSALGLPLVQAVEYLHVLDQEDRHADRLVIDVPALTRPGRGQSTSSSSPATSGTDNCPKVTRRSPPATSGAPGWARPDYRAYFTSWVASRRPHPPRHRDGCRRKGDRRSRCSRSRFMLRGGASPLGHRARKFGI